MALSGWSCGRGPSRAPAPPSAGPLSKALAPLLRLNLIYKFALPGTENPSVSRTRLSERMSSRNKTRPDLPPHRGSGPPQALPGPRQCPAGTGRAPGPTPGTRATACAMVTNTGVPTGQPAVQTVLLDVWSSNYLPK